MALLALAAAAAQTVTLVAFSDYHSHAAPFYSEGAPGQAGLARAVAYLRERRKGGALLFSGGDMFNKSAPTWSDEYRCADWRFLDGLVGAMALGNHDLDYGPAELERCRASVRFPVLSANLVHADGSPYLAVAGKPYVLKSVGGVRVGVFALGGPDVQGLVRSDDLPPATHWADATETARAVVKEMRAAGASLVVLIGHQTREEDFALAQAVPGIDVIFGSHSHLKLEPRQIPGTRTLFISPSAYLTYVAEVRVGIDSAGRVVQVEGALRSMNESRPEAPDVAKQIAEMQRQLEAKRPERFAVIGRACVELSDAGCTSGECAIGNWATELLRATARAHAFLMTASSFRAAIPPGDVTEEAFLAAFPYKNQIVTTTLTGRELRALLAFAASRLGSDSFSQASGVRYVVRAGQIAEVEVLQDPEDPPRGFAPLDDDASYRVATTDYQAFAVAGYRELLAGPGLTRTGLDVHAVLREALRRGEVRSALDGRVRLEAR